MNIKKIIASVAAAAVAVSTLAVSVFAADEYTAKLGFADTAWAAQDWDTAVTVTGDGQYTIESTAVAGAVDFGVFVIDIEGMYAGSPEATAVLDKVEVDGNELAFDASKIVYGDVEEKGNFRIEIYNQYGTTKDDSPVDQSTAVASSIKVTFTVSGLGGGDAAAADTATTDTAADTAADAATETTPAATGNTSAAVIVSVMALAGIAAVASKRK